MERMKFAEELVREFLVFRGFTNTLQAFEKELATDIGKRFEVDKILYLIFSVYIPKFEAEKLIDLLTFFKNCFSYADSNLTDVISKLNQSILHYYVIYALNCGRKDKVLEFFRDFGNDLMRRDESWSSWFAVPYLQNPQLDPQFRVYFSEEWFRTLDLSLRNFLSDMLNGTHILYGDSMNASFDDHADDDRSDAIGQGFREDSVAGSSSDLQSEEDFPEVKTVFQDTFLGHTSPISCSRFSASGDNIASASVDGTVRPTIHQHQHLEMQPFIVEPRSCLLSGIANPIGTSDGGIKAWNVDAKRVVCDLSSTETYPSILDLKCSPVEPIFVSAAASRRQGSGYFDSLGFASLTVWNMRTWKAMSFL